MSRRGKQRARSVGLRRADYAHLGAYGLRSRPVRVLLSAMGIGIGVAAMLAVIGISSSSRSQLNSQLDRLGTNLLRVSPAKDLQGNPTTFPETVVPMVRRIGPVTAASATGRSELGVYRTPLVPTGQTGSITLRTSDRSLLRTVRGSVAAGRWLAAVDDRFPTVVIGAEAARHLGVQAIGTPVWCGVQWCSVVGILRPVTLAPELDSSVLVSWQAARQYLRFDGTPATVYVRTTPDQVEAVAAVLPPTAKPQDPGTVRVDRPSDALAARQASDRTLGALLVGLAAVALLVGGIGVANTMVITVLERRPEVGLRRSLGATRGAIRVQFLAESFLLSSLGGLIGVVLGTVVTAVYALSQGWPVEVPVYAPLAGLVTTSLIGALAGLYPAVRASRIPPTQALA